MSKGRIQLPNVIGLTQVPVAERPRRDLRFAERMERIGLSGISEFLAKGREVPDAVDLSLGQAHFDVPLPLKEATIEALRQPCGRYSPPGGDPQLVSATRRYLEERYGLADGDDVMTTCGVSGAITLALLALVGPGDEVLVPDPYFVIYDNLVAMAGATPVFYELGEGFRLCAGEIEKRLTERTRLLILNTPANPTGVAFTAAELQAVAELCRERGLLVLSDELYELFVYDAPHVSVKQLECESLLVSGFSKSYGMGGWRLGWAAGPAALLERMRTLQLFLYVSPATPLQRGASVAFEVDMSAVVERYREKRDFMYEGLVAAGYEVTKPAGSFFLYPRVPWGDDLAFCDYARRQKLILLPGRCFSRRSTHFRVNFAEHDEILERGLEVLARIVKP